MVTASTLRRTLLGREVAVTFGLLVVLYLVRVVRFQPTQIPAYLLIVAYDLVEVAAPVLVPYHDVGFPLFLYLLAVLGASATRWLRAGDDATAAALRVAGGACLLVGTLSLLFAALVGGPLIGPVDNPTPLAITLATGIAFLLGAWALLGSSTVGSLGADDET